MDFESFLGSRSLVGFQLDASHLHAVLMRLAQAQTRLAADNGAIMRRLEQIENGVEELSQFASRTSAFLDSMGNPDEVRAIAAHVTQLDRVVEQLNVRDLPELRRIAEDSARRGVSAERAVQQVQQMAQEAHDHARAIREDVTQLSDNQRNFALDLRNHQTTVEDIRTRGGATQRVDERLREIEVQLQRVEREAVGRLASGLADLNARCDDNFRAVEVAVRQYDEDGRRIKADLSNLRAEVNGLDNDAAHRLNKIKEDMDGKFAMLLQLMQNFERNSQAVETILTDAGRALSHTRGASRATSEVGSATPYRGGVSPGIGSAGGRAPSWGGHPDYVATTTTTGRTMPTL